MKQKTIKFLLLLLILGLISCQNKKIKKFVFQPNSEQGKDAAISAGNEKANFSKLDKIHILSLSSDDSIPNDARFLIRIGFESIPENKVIDSAFIYLYASEPGHFGKDNSFVVEPLKEMWIYSEVNWSNQPKSDIKKGHKYEAPKSNLQDYKIDITNYVNEVLQNERPNYGFLFKLENEEKSYKGLKFHSSESKTERKRPKLEIYYTE